MGHKGAKLTERATVTSDLLAEKLEPLGDVTCRKMFGGYGIFESGTMFALVNAAGVAHLKVDESNVKKFIDAGSQKHGKMPYYSIPDHVLASTRSLRNWAKHSLAIAKSVK